MKSRHAAILYINGERHEVCGTPAFMMLADYLRYECGLVGTKIVCAEGDCGACTVLHASVLNPRTKVFEAINSCITSVAQLDGAHIVTVEGLSSEAGLSPVQNAVASCHGSQCGYCTPGFVMAITACLQKPRENLNAQQVKNHLTGNLCRCTGYAPLIEAALAVDQKSLPRLEDKHRTPQQIKEVKSKVKTSLHISDDTRQFFAPTTLKDALAILKKYPKARIIAAATDLGVQINKGKAEPEIFLSLHLIPELYQIKKSKNRLQFGARVNLTEVREACEESVPEFATFINIFASPQIKNIGSLVGNVANGSPIGDTLPFLMVAEAVVHIAGPNKERTIDFTDLYVGYRQLALKPGELMTAISFKVPKVEENLRLFKVSQRRDLDISTVNSAFLLHFNNKAEIKSARICYGGVGATVLRFEKAEDFLVGKTLSEETITATIDLIQQEIAPLSDVRGTAGYRRALVDGLFRRYCAELQEANP